MRQNSEYLLNPDATVETIRHEDPEISVCVIDDFLANPELLVNYAKTRAYFGQIGADRTAYPGIRDRLPGHYERVMEEAITCAYAGHKAHIHRCMLSLTTVDPQNLSAAQRIPHTDAFGDNQFAAVHYLCDPPHGGTAIYRYLPRNSVRIRSGDRETVMEMLQKVHDYPQEHCGYIAGDTKFYKQELVIDAKFNRLVLYPSNLLHCALLTSRHSLSQDVSTGRLTVASFFQLDPL